MIKFYFEDKYVGANAQASVSTQAESIDGVVAAFKIFLALVGYHQDTISKIHVEGDGQGFKQLDLFSDDDGSESGV